MTQITCPSCQLRFSRVAAAPLRACPFCGGLLTAVGARDTVGFQLIERVAALDELPDARADALPRPPEPGGATGP